MCNGMLDVACQAGDWVSDHLLLGLGKLADEAAQGAADLFAKSMMWWVNTPSINLGPQSTNLPEIIRLQGYLGPVVALVLVMSVLSQAGQMAITRRKEPLINIVGGLIRYAVTVSVGLSVEWLLLQIVDAFCHAWFEQAALDFSRRIGVIVKVLVPLNAVTGLVLSIIFLVLAGIQWVLAMIRQSGLIVLAVLLPLAASGSLNRLTKSWLPKMISWAMMLTTYKLFAMLIYAIGLGMLGAAQDISSMFIGLMILALAILCLPLMMKFFAPFGADTSGAGVAGVLAGAGLAAAGAVRLAAGIGGGGAAASAARVEQSGPGSHSGPTGHQIGTGHQHITTGQQQVGTGQQQIGTGQQQITTGQRQLTTSQRPQTGSASSGGPSGPAPSAGGGGAPPAGGPAGGAASGGAASGGAAAAAGPAAAAALGAAAAAQGAKRTVGKVGEQFGGPADGST